MTTIEEALKNAADKAMLFAAQHCNRLRGLKAIADSGLIDEEAFGRLAGEAICTLESSLTSWRRMKLQPLNGHVKLFLGGSNTLRITLSSSIR